MYDVTQWAYSRLAPGAVADDVKCFTFRGRTALVQHVSERFDTKTGRPKSSEKRDTFYDPRSGAPRAIAVDGQPSLPADSQRRLSPARVRRASAVCDGLGRGLDFA